MNLRIERLWGGGLCAFGIVYGLYAFRYPMGSIARPGPGSLPFILALGLILVGLGLLFSNSDDVLPKGANRRTGTVGATGTMAAVLLGYAWLMPIMGPALTTAAAVFILMKLFKLRGWMLPALFSAAYAVGITLLFLRFLRIPLPDGMSLIKGWLR